MTLVASLFGDCLRVTDSSNKEHPANMRLRAWHTLIMVQDGTKKGLGGLFCLLPGNFCWLAWWRFWWMVEETLPGILRASRSALSAPTSGPPAVRHQRMYFDFPSPFSIQKKKKSTRYFLAFLVGDFYAPAAAPADCEALSLLEQKLVRANVNCVKM